MGFAGVLVGQTLVAPCRSHGRMEGEHTSPVARQGHRNGQQVVIIDPRGRGQRCYTLRRLLTLDCW